MSAPKLFVASGGTLLEADRGHQDLEETYELRARTNPVAPAGAGGEAIFTGLYLVITFDMPFRARVTPVLDGIPIWEESTEISNTNTLAQRETHLFQIGLSKAHLRGGVEISRHHLRGTWFQAEIGMPCPPDQEGTFIVERGEVEYTIVSEGQSVS